MQRLSKQYGSVSVSAGPIMRIGKQFLVGPYYGPSAKRLGMCASGKTLVIGLGAGLTRANAERYGEVTTVENNDDVLLAWKEDTRCERGGDSPIVQVDVLNFIPEEPFDTVLGDVYGILHLVPFKRLLKLRGMLFWIGLGVPKHVCEIQSIPELFSHGIRTFVR